MSKLLIPKRKIEQPTRAEALAILAERGIPVFQGGDGTAVAERPGRTIQADTSAYPFAPPAPGPGTTITVETMLNQPTRITRVIQDMTLQRFLLDQLFRSAGGVTGGAVVYDMPTENDLYSSRDVQRVEPGAEFPILTSELIAPRMATPEKWGAKVFITDEARDRNNQSRFQIELRKMANTLVRKLNQRAIEVMEAIFTEFTGQVVAGHNWTNVTTQGTNPTAYSLQPIGDFVAVDLANEQQELGMTFNTILLNPQEAARLQLIYGAEWQAVLAAYGYTNRFISNRVAAGTAYVLAAGQLGELRFEKPIGTETWREQKTERTWVQTSVRPLLYVNNPFAVRKLTGLAG